MTLFQTLFLTGSIAGLVTLLWVLCRESSHVIGPLFRGEDEDS